MIKRRFVCEICDWKSIQFRIGIIFSDPRGREAENALVEHFESKHPDIQIENIWGHIAFMDDITGTYVQSYTEKTRKEE